MGSEVTSPCLISSEYSSANLSENFISKRIPESFHFSLFNDPSNKAFCESFSHSSINNSIVTEGGANGLVVLRLLKYLVSVTLLKSDCSSSDFRYLHDIHQVRAKWIASRIVDFPASLSQTRTLSHLSNWIENSPS
jgi:hypothetical protein